MPNSRFVIAAMLLVAATLADLHAQTTVWSIPDNGQPGFGDFVASAGNLDGDNLPDYLVTTRSDANGALLSFRRGEQNQEQLVLTLPPIEDIDRIGDLNADGASDIGVLSRDASNGAVTIWLYSGLSGTPIALPLLPPGISVGVGTAACIEPLGDINSDGRDDFAVALTGGTEVFPGQTCSTSIPGVTHIYSGMDGSLLRTHPGAGGKAACEVSRLDDMTGDGISEYAIGGLGQLTTFQGGPCPGVPEVSSSLEVFSGSTGAPLQSHTAGALYGLGVAATADINFDGIADILSQSRDAASATTNQVLNHIVSGLDGSGIFCFHAPTAGQPIFGIYSAGDLNGDFSPEFFVVDTQAIHILSGANADILWSMPTDISTTARSPVAHLGSLAGNTPHQLVLSLNNPRRVIVLSPTDLAPARTYSIGQGLGALNRPPPEFSLSAAPNLGETVTFRYSQGTPLAIGGILWALPIAAYHLPTGHPMHIYLSESEVLENFTLDANGEWAWPLYLPPNYAVIGNEVHMQCYALSPTAPAGVEVTNGLYLRFGPPNF